MVCKKKYQNVLQSFHCCIFQMDYSNFLVVFAVSIGEFEGETVMNFNPEKKPPQFSRDAFTKPPVNYNIQV